MNDGTKGTGDANTKGLAARAMDEPVRPEPATRPTLHFVRPVRPSDVTPASYVTEPDPVEPRGLDREIKKARRAVHEWERAIDEAHRDRSTARAEGEALIAEAERTYWDRTRKRRLEVLHAQYDDAVARYLHADKKRLEAKARLSSLLAVRERWLLERDGVATTPRRPDSNEFEDG